MSPSPPPPCSLSRTRAWLLSLATVALAAVAGCGGGSSSQPPSTDAGHDSGRDSGHNADAGSKDAAPTGDVFVAARAPGQRTPLSAACDPVDGTRCLLPWPSNTFTIVDTTTETGLRVNVAQQGIAMVDSPASINRADGFSRVAPIETGFPGILDTTTLGDLTTGSVRLIVEQPGATFGQVVPVRFDSVVYTDPSSNESTSLLIADPRVPLAANTDYAVVVMNSAHYMGGAPLTADRNAQVALGLVPPATEAEGALFAYDAPARQAMQAAGVDPQQAVRVWDFTTRSANEATADLSALRAVELAAYDSALGDAGIVDAGGPLPVGSPDGGQADASDEGGPGPMGIALDYVSTTPTGTVLMSVLGRVTNVPSFLTTTGSMNRNDAGTPVQTGVHDVPFRVAVPVGTGDYRVVMYGHGTGGTYDETTFDQEVTGNGAAKIGNQFDGWTAQTVPDTFALFDQILIGTDISTSRLTQSLADIMVVQRALGGALGTALAQPTLRTLPNPAAGRSPNMNQPVWAGGSLGGILGFVYCSAEPTISAAVLNVPGAGWAQFVPHSLFFDYVQLIMAVNYPDPISISMGVVESQINFDPIDGAPWYDTAATHPILMEQESIGDPVVPNMGNELVATSSHADQVAVALSPIDTCTDVSSAVSHNAMTQFKVPSSVTDPLQIHGFAAGSTPAGVAAQQQIISFIGSVWAGSPVIGIPQECVMNTPMNSCDFTNAQ